MVRRSTIESPDERASAFASTQWSVVHAARGARTSPVVQAALTRLCHAYWYPLYVFIRRRGYTADDAEELTQEFFARLLEKDTLDSADPARGRFRTFLLACCQHFLANQRDFAAALKRGGGRPVLSLDFASAAARYHAEPVCAETAVFARRWALTVLDRVFGQLQGEYQRAGKGVLFDHLKDTLVGGADALAHAQIAAAAGMTEDAVRKAAQRLRQRFRSVLRAHIAETVSQPADIDEEIRDLFTALAR